MIRAKFNRKLAESMEVCRVEFVIKGEEDKTPKKRGRKIGSKDSTTRVRDGQLKVKLPSGEVVRGWKLRSGEVTPYYGVFLADQVEKRRAEDFAAMHTIPHPEGCIDPRTGKVMLLTPYSLAVVEGRGDEFCEVQYHPQYRGKNGKRFEEDRF